METINNVSEEKPEFLEETKKPFVRLKPMAIIKHNLPANRFSGRNVRGNSRKRNNLLKRDRRLRKYGYSVIQFAS